MIRCIRRPGTGGVFALPFVCVLASRLLFSVGLLASAGALRLAGPAWAADAPPDFVIENAFPGVSFSLPVAFSFLPDGRTLVAEKAGIVRVVLADGTKLSAPFLDLSVETEGTGDLGLLGLAVDPDFGINRWVYVGYTVDTGLGDRYSRVERYRADLGNPDVADLSTRQFLIGETWSGGFPTLDISHSICALRFAPDKSLLVGHGDGGRFEDVDAGGEDPGGFGAGRIDPAEDIGAFRARTLNSRSGKILRIDKETGFGLSSNPYWDGNPTSDRSRVWLYGLRNPYRFDLRPGTGSTNPADGDPGTLYIGDVGWADYEEICVARNGGENFGWPCVEGPDPNGPYQDVESTAAGNMNVLCDAAPTPENPSSETAPALWWSHDVAGSSNPPGHTGRSVTGGVFYTGARYPAEYVGRYFVADYIRDWMFVVEMDENDTLVERFVFSDTADRPVDFQSHPVTGDVYYASISSGEIRHIRYDNPSALPDVDGDPGKPFEIVSFPNPFARATTVELRLEREMEVSAQVYDSGGRRIRTLFQAESLAAGPHRLVWDGRDDDGRERPSGVFFLELRTPVGSETRKIVLERR